MNKIEKMSDTDTRDQLDKDKEINVVDLVGDVIEDVIDE